MSMIRGIIAMSIGVILLSSVFITTVKAANTTGWSTSETAMWGLLSLMGIVGLVYGIGSVFGIV